MFIFFLHHQTPHIIEWQVDSTWTILEIVLNRSLACKHLRFVYMSTCRRLQYFLSSAAFCSLCLKEIHIEAREGTMHLAHVRHSCWCQVSTGFLIIRNLYRRLHGFMCDKTALFVKILFRISHSSICTRIVPVFYSSTSTRSTCHGPILKTSLFR